MSRALAREKARLAEDAQYLQERTQSHGQLRNEKIGERAPLPARWRKDSPKSWKADFPRTAQLRNRAARRAFWFGGGIGRANRGQLEADL